MLCEKGKFCGIGLDEIKDFKIMILLVDDSSSKAPACNAGDRRPGFDPWVGKIPWRRAVATTPVFLPGKSHGQRTLAG